eukprot:5264238-Amphidinium_carterae.1
MLEIVLVPCATIESTGKLYIAKQLRRELGATELIWVPYGGETEMVWDLLNWVQSVFAPHGSGTIV